MAINTKQESSYILVKSSQEACSVYPKTVEEITARTEKTIEELKEISASIRSLTESQRNKNSLLLRGDLMFSKLNNVALLYTVCNLHPDSDVRKKALESFQKIQKVFSELSSTNVDMAKAYVEYFEKQAKNDDLTPTQMQCSRQNALGFKLSGILKDAETQQRVKTLVDECQALSSEYLNNTKLSNITLEFSLDELEGISDDFISRLKKNEEGLYLLNINEPTLIEISRYAKKSETRKKYFLTYQNRCYESNKRILKNLIRKRRELSKISGYKSFAHKSLVTEMVKDPQTAWNFLKDLEVKNSSKAISEYETFTSSLPESVILTDDGKIQPWDYSYAYNHFRKKMEVDEKAISEYFELERTLGSLFNIFENFFSIKITKTKAENSWHPSVELIEIRNEIDQILGYVFLDLFPRDGKHSHASKIDGVGAYISEDGLRHPAVVTTTMNFTPATDEKPCLLLHSQVKTFFHEFGHALHSVFGATEMIQLSGTNVPRDFVEAPSQLLEKWMHDFSTLKEISCHYKTSEKIPDEMLTKKLNFDKFGDSLFICDQLAIAMTSLAIHNEKRQSDIEAVFKKYQTRLKPYIATCDESHSMFRIVHFASYGAKYYSYLWSDVTAKKIFEYIKSQGLTNKSVGDHYKKCILEKGGSKDPTEMIQEFLKGHSTASKA